MKLSLISGQSLVEILVAVAIASILIGGVVSTYLVSLKSNANSRISSVATQLGEELFENVKALGESNWNQIYNLSRDTDYHLDLVNNVLTPTLNSENLSFNNDPYERSFKISEVERNGGGDVVATGLGEVDPSTLLITVSVKWSIGGSSGETKAGGYISRVKNTSLRLTDWSSGDGGSGPFVGQSSSFFSATNVDWSSLKGSIKLSNF